MRSTFVRFRCAALSSSFDAPTRPTMHSNAITVVSAARVLHATSVLQVQHARRVMMVISCALLFASLTMASPPLTKSVIYVYGSHLRKISVLYIKHIYIDGSCWDIIIIKQIHTFTSNILFEQRRFGLGFPSLYQVKWQEENEKPTNTELLFFASRTNWNIYGATQTETSLWGNPERNVVAQTMCC